MCPAIPQPHQHGPVQQAQTYLNKVLRERDLGRRVEGVTVTLDEFLNRWLDTAAKPKLRQKSYYSYESLLRRYIRPALGERILSAITPLDVRRHENELETHGRPLT
jgi:integrase